MTTTDRLDSMVVRGFVPQWTLGDRLRKAREAVGLKQSQLADEIGIARGSLISYESGQATPRRPVLLSWAMVCAVDSVWLLTGEVPKGYVAGDNTSRPPGDTSVTALQRSSYLVAA